MEVKTPSRSLPDVAHEKLETDLSPLEWVGMSGIEVPVLVSGEDGLFRQAAKADAFVSLDRSPSRGIHMSRLYLTVQELLAKEELNLALLRRAVEDFLLSHRDLSSSARLSVHLEMPVLRPALVSGHVSWRTYPATFSVEKVGEQIRSFLEVTVTYSSTCPASAALSRRLIQEGFRQDFSSRELTLEAVEEWLGTTRGIQATPHAQRSLARVKVQTDDLNMVDLVDVIEDALQTAVQGAVKREDEQEFARRNGQNLMFCEDAARRVRAALETMSGVTAYRAELDHLESLHPHSAKATVSRGMN